MEPRRAPRPPRRSARCFDALVARRRRGEPIAYLTGRREFWSFDLVVTPDTLIPRPETEHLVEAALRVVAPDAAATIADIGTGSGAVAIAIARERPRAFVVGTDRSPAAVAVACANAMRLDVRNVSFVAADACGALAPGGWSVIVSNPPYVAENDPHLTTGDVRFEPREALVSGPRGLDMLDALARHAPRRLVSGGWLVLEHGREQGPEVRALLSRGGFTSVETVSDLAGNERVTLGRRTPTDGGRSRSRAPPERVDSCRHPPTGRNALFVTGFPLPRESTRAEAAGELPYKRESMQRLPNTTAQSRARRRNSPHDSRGQVS